MSLLMLKTRDLTWQDHTLNVEVMSSPNHSQLLFNKHKTFGTQYTKEVELYQKQINTMLKDITVEKRLMERQRERLISRQRELVLQRSQSAMAYSKHSLLDGADRSRSAPVGSLRNSSPPRQIGRQSRGLFLTEVEEEKMSKLPAVGSKKSKLQKLTINLPSPVKRTPRPKAVNLGRRQYVTFGVHPHPEPDSDSDDAADATKPHPLDVKIKSFLDEVKSFNEKPVPRRRFPGSADFFSYLKEKESKDEPLVAKRYNSLSIDRQKLESAFDSFCKTKSKEDLVRMMRLAAKMKANVAQARNASMVPTAVATMKASRTFLSLRSAPRSKSVTPVIPT